MRNIQKYFGGQIQHGAIFALLIIVLAPAVHAIDGGLGRSISGAQILPYQAVVPSEEGAFFASIDAAYYPGVIGGQKTFPQGEKFLADMDADLTLVSLTLAYDWPGVKSKWNVLSAISVPWADVSVDANVTVGESENIRSHDSDSGLYDIMFRIVQASYHISPVQHVSVAFDIWAPTGSYDRTRLANLSLDNWTYIATFSYTQIFPEQNIEFSGLGAIEYYSPNRSTTYQSGIMSRVEALGIKRFPSGIGVGLVGSWMQQLSNDTGPVASALNGFKGRAFGIGPMVTWIGKAGKTPLNLTARWVHEFENKNLLQGDVFTLSIGTQF